MKWFMRGALVVFLLLSGAATVIAGGAQEAGKGPVTVTFMVDDSVLPRSEVDSFLAANPDINLVRVEASFEKWLADALAGTAADLLMLDGFEVAYYVKRHLLFDMSTLMRASKVIDMKDIDPLGNVYFQYDGREYGKGAWYGLSKDYNNIGCITYNAQMFKKAGLAPLSTTQPITYEDELYTLAKKLTQKDSTGNTIVFGTEFAAVWVAFLVSDMAHATGTSFWTDKTASQLNSDAKLRDLWKYWARFKVEDISSNSRNPASGWTGSMFQSDRAAIVQLGYWFGAQLASGEGYEEKYAWAPTPILRAGSKRYTNTLGAAGTAIYAKSKHPKEAFRVFEWFNAGEIAMQRAKTGWGLPPFFSMQKYLPAGNKFNKDRLDIALDDAKYFVPFEGALSYVASPRSLYQNPWNAYIDQLTDGKMSYDDFVDRMYADIGDALKSGKEELGL